MVVALLCGIWLLSHGLSDRFDRAYDCGASATSSHGNVGVDESHGIGGSSRPDALVLIRSFHYGDGGSSVHVEGATHEESPVLQGFLALGILMARKPRRSRRPRAALTVDSPVHELRPLCGVLLWPSRDLIGERGGYNLYAFVGNDGVNWLDYLGLKRLDLGFSIINPSQGESELKERIVHLNRVDPVESLSELLKQIKKKIRKYSETGSGKCDCVEKLVIWSHGSPGSIDTGYGLIDISGGGKIRDESIRVPYGPGADDDVKRYRDQWDRNWDNKSAAIRRGAYEALKKAEAIENASRAMEEIAGYMCRDSEVYF